jgi:O-antigen/teichoic acid export membrane protein
MIRRFVKDTLIYSIPMFLAKAIGLILLPIYARQLGPTDFGFVEIIAATSAILLLILPLEINQAVARLLPEADNSSAIRKLLSTALWFTFWVFLGFSGLVYLFRYQLLHLASISPNYAQYAGLVCFNILITAILNLLQIQFRFTSQAALSITINMVVVLTNLVLVLYFSIFQRLGINQFFISQIISGSAGCLVGLLMLMKRQGHLYGYMDFELLRKLLNYSTPILISSIGVTLSTNIDKLMVGKYVGLTELGQYGVAVRFAGILSLFFYCVSSAMTPIVYREHHKPETKNLIIRIFNFTAWGALLVIASTIFYSESLIGMLAGDGFIAGGKYIFYVLLSSVIANLYIFFLGMDIQKNTKLLSKINLTSGLIGTIGCIALVPVIGIWGAIASSIVANLSRLTSYVHYSQKTYPLPIKFRWLLSIAIATTLLNISYQNLLN